MLGPLLNVCRCGGSRTRVLEVSVHSGNCNWFLWQGHFVRNSAFAVCTSLVLAAVSCCLSVACADG